MKRGIIVAICLIFVLSQWLSTVASHTAIANRQPQETIEASEFDYTWVDNFDSPSLNPRWSWIREDNAHWSLTANPGYLQITTQPGLLYGPDGDANNILLQDAPQGDFVITTKVAFDPTEDFHYAGLLIYQDDDNYILLNRGFCSFYGGTGVYFDSEVTGSTTTISTTLTITTTYLKIEKTGSNYVGYYSEDGDTWMEVGQHNNPSLSEFKIGLSASNNNDDPTVSEISANFDYFRLDANYYKIYLPIIMNNHP